MFASSSSQYLNVAAAALAVLLAVVVVVVVGKLPPTSSFVVNIVHCHLISLKNGKKCHKQLLVECGWYFITPSRATIRLSCGRPFSFLTSPDFCCVPHMHHLSLNFG
jgi:hypothetical protein